MIRNALLVIVINLILFGIIEALSLSSMEIMTPARVVTHVGFVVNLVLVVVALVGKPVVRG